MFVLICLFVLDLWIYHTNFGSIQTLQLARSNAKLWPWFLSWHSYRSKINLRARFWRNDPSRRSNQIFWLYHRVNSFSFNFKSTFPHKCRRAITICFRDSTNINKSNLTKKTIKLITRNPCDAYIRTIRHIFSFHITPYRFQFKLSFIPCFRPTFIKSKIIFNSISLLTIRKNKISLSLFF